MAQIVAILSRIIFQNELQRLGVVPSGGVRVQRPYPPIRTPQAGETVGLSRNPPHWVHPLL